ncbi:hypothetical protein MTBBW1_1670031 [Desulfamplus magnetovallimortis]|uniref:Uncharacterized protein n=1 Tax=Desulfamplus magnetovallimortis TaxID=1246637 RepID=A0A1W1H9C6_9BACT|nr:hypothetical protein MTBBW1_1670031 [Desulfamplus magnetovallimortis]
MLAQPKSIRERMAKGVEEFVYNILVNVFNAEDTASIAIEDIIRTGTPDPGNKTGIIENPENWTKEQILEKGKLMDNPTGPSGDFDD